MEHASVDDLDDASSMLGIQPVSNNEKAPSIKEQRKENRLARAALRVKSVWTTIARRKLNFDSANMQGNAYVQF